MKKSGFALIEIILYLGILSLLLTIASLSLVSFTYKNQSNNNINKSISDLIFLDHKINQAIEQGKDFTIAQEAEFIYWQIAGQEKELVMTAPLNSLSTSESPSDLGHGKVFNTTIEIDYLPLTIYHYLP